MHTSRNEKGDLRSSIARVMAGAVGPAAALLVCSWLSAEEALAQRPLSDAGLGGGPARLSTVARAALERNRDVIGAEYELAVANGRVSEAWSDVYPNVDFSSSYTRNVAPQVSFLPAQIFDPSAAEGDFIPVQFGADNIWNLSVNLEQTVLDPRVFVGLGAASRFRGLQREILRGRSQEVVTRVRIAFYDLLLAQEEVRLTENSLKRVRQSLDETRAMQEAGVAEAYDVLRLEVEVANLEPNLRRAENRRRAAQRTIAAELDLDPGQEIEVAGELALIDLDDFEGNSAANRDILAFNGIVVDEHFDVSDLIRRGTAERSDLRQLRSTESLRKAELRIEQTGYLPTASVFGTYGLAAQQNGPPVFFGTSNQRGTSKQLGFRVSMPLFSGFRENSLIAQRQAALRQAEIQTRAATDQAAVQLSNLVDDARAARSRTAAQGLAVSQARRGYEIASARYREGLASQLELTDAEVALRQSEFNYAQAVYDYLATRARLDEAAGMVPLVDVPVGRDPSAGNGKG